MQKLAESLKIDPFEFRLTYALGIGDATITGDVLNDINGANIKKCLLAVKSAVDKFQPPVLEYGERLGIGYAAAYKNVGLGSNIPDKGSARVSLEKDGSFLVRHGAADMGQGSNDVAAIVASRVLGISLSQIHLHTGDTKVDPPGGMTTASRATFITGNAVFGAAQGLREKIWEEVASEFNVKVEDVEFLNGIFSDKRSGRKFISINELAKYSKPFEYEFMYLSLIHI